MQVGLPQHSKIGSMNDKLRGEIALIISIDVERAADKMELVALQSPKDVYLLYKCAVSHARDSHIALHWVVGMESQSSPGQQAYCKCPRPNL